MKPQNVLISPLDWGLGHATRCIPIIKSLLDKGAKVTIAGSGSSIQLLKEEFPAISFLEIPGFEMSYGNHVMLSMLKLMPKFLKLVAHENNCVRDWQQQYSFDLIISDNRYGFRHNKVSSILISHQLSPKFPKGVQFASKPIQKQLNKWMDAFDEIWVPDFNDSTNLSGSLSNNKNLSVPIKFIGPLSRFDSKKITETKHGVVAVLSGPEPARSIFEKKIVLKLETMGTPSILVRGLPCETSIPNFGNHIKVFNHLKAKELNDLMLNSELIISRAGYSTIMDLYHLNKSAVLIPTPGQTEQEYLSAHLTTMGCWKFCNENKIQLPTSNLPLPQEIFFSTSGSLNKIDLFK